MSKQRAGQCAGECDALNGEHEVGSGRAASRGHGPCAGPEQSAREEAGRWPKPFILESSPCVELIKYISLCLAISAQSQDINIAV